MESLWDSDGPGHYKTRQQERPLTNVQSPDSALKRRAILVLSLRDEEAIRDSGYEFHWKQRGTTNFSLNANCRLTGRRYCRFRSLMDEITYLDGVTCFP